MNEIFDNEAVLLLVQVQIGNWSNRKHDFSDDRLERILKSLKLMREYFDMEKELWTTVSAPTDFELVNMR